MSADLRSAVIDIGTILKSAASPSQPHRSQSGRTGMSSRSVTTRIPARYHVADRALIQIYRLGASKMLDWAANVASLLAFAIDAPYPSLHSRAGSRQISRVRLSRRCLT